MPGPPPLNPTSPWSRKRPCPPGPESHWVSDGPHPKGKEESAQPGHLEVLWTAGVETGNAGTGPGSGQFPAAPRAEQARIPGAVWKTSLRRRRGQGGGRYGRPPSPRAELGGLHGAGGAAREPRRAPVHGALLLTGTGDSGFKSSSYVTTSVLQLH